MVKLWQKDHLLMLAPLPAVVIGASVMHQNAISPLVYGQNLICYLVSGLLVLFLTAKPTSAKRGNRFYLALLTVGCLALAGTFLDHGLENVHRWLAIGNFRLYIASLVIPSMIIGLGQLLSRKRLTLLIAALMALLLLFQPDASQLSAFVVSVVFLVWMQVKQPLLKCGVTLLSAAAMVYSWMHLDVLAPVAHVEGILRMAQEMGTAWFWLGIGSLILLPVPLLGFSRNATPAKAVGLYYLIVLMSTFFGNFPVPFMGFGVSPILGYQLALFFLRRERQELG